MTECERLVKEGSLPAEFLLPEKRECEVSAEMKKLWALQIDLLGQVEQICKKHQLTYFAIGGTAIGAVRHKGFIPWDDDVDVALKRDDYNAFLKYAEHELEAPYFLQIPTTDPYYFRPFAALRNSNATCIAKGDNALKCNNGAIIHIFPLDSYTPNKKLDQFIKKERMKNIIAVNSYHYSGRSNHRIARTILKLLKPFVVGNTEKYFIDHEKKCTEISNQYHDQLGIQYAHYSSRIDNLMCSEVAYESATYVPFEYSKIPIPVGYDEMLTRMFGDYMQLPPESKRINKHTWEMNLDMPYKEYCSQKYGVKY